MLEFHLRIRSRSGTYEIVLHLDTASSSTHGGGSEAGGANIEIGLGEGGDARVIVQLLDWAIVVCSNAVGTSSAWDSPFVSHVEPGLGAVYKLEELVVKNKGQ